MKKMTLLAMAMMLAMAPAGVMAEEAESGEAVEAAAEESEVPELNWSDVEESVAEIDGDFVSFDEIAVKMWVPAVLEPVELTDEDREAGYIGYFQTADETAAVGVMYVDMDGMSLEEYMASLEETEGVDAVQLVMVNGIEAVSYDMPDADTTVLAFVTEGGYVMEFSFAPISDEGFAATTAIMGCSIQEDAEAVAEEEAAAE